MDRFCSETEIDEENCYEKRMPKPSGKKPMGVLAQRLVG